MKIIFVFLIILLISDVIQCQIETNQGKYNFVLLNISPMHHVGSVVIFLIQKKNKIKILIFDFKGGIFTLSYSCRI